MFIVLLAVTMISLGWFSTTATTTPTMMTVAKSSHADPEVINGLLNFWQISFPFFL